jgi:hypothetical protein
MSVTTTEVDCMTGTGVQLCSYPQRELYSIESISRRCRVNPTARTSAAAIDSHLPEYPTRQRSRLQLVASTTTKANRANINEFAGCRPQEWQAQECDPSPPTTTNRGRTQECQSRKNTTINEREPSITGRNYTVGTNRGEHHRSARAATL